MGKWAFLLITLLSCTLTARANESDDTIAFQLAEAELVIDAELVSKPRRLVETRRRNWPGASRNGATGHGRARNWNRRGRRHRRSPANVDYDWHVVSLHGTALL